MYVIKITKSSENALNWHHRLRCKLWRSGMSWDVQIIILRPNQQRKEWDINCVRTKELANIFNLFSIYQFIPKWAIVCLILIITLSLRYSCQRQKFLIPLWKKRLWRRNFCPEKLWGGCWGKSCHLEKLCFYVISVKCQIFSGS